MAAAFSCDNQLLLTAMVTGLPKFVDRDWLTAMSVASVDLYNILKTATIQS